MVAFLLRWDFLMLSLLFSHQLFTSLSYSARDGELNLDIKPPKPNQALQRTAGGASITGGLLFLPPSLSLGR